ncbi:MAG: pseudouridine synthase [Bacteroidia bacterium]|nr:pseudouridine synthase [Bacteroidia bacterium]
MIDPAKSKLPPKKTEKKSGPQKEKKPVEPIRLNRFIAQAGVCSRRDADKLISAGEVKVNGEVNTEMGMRVHPFNDVIEYKGKRLRVEKFVYILLNKPKNTITTTDDPQGRKTVLDIVKNTTDERIFPVGRLDRNTTGLLLLSNDGALAKKMTHPSHKVKKIYHVRLNKEVSEEDMEKLLTGIELEDGPAKVDKIDYVIGKERDEVGVEIHIGRNRIVRRMFEHMGYQVVGLDRVSIAHLTKKNLPRGKFRSLSDKEVAFLKMI